MAQREQVLLSHSSSFLGARCLLPSSSCSCSICTNYFSGFSHLLFAKMAELFHPVLFWEVFSVFLPGFPRQLPLLTTRCFPGAVITVLRHYPSTEVPPARGCSCVCHSVTMRMAQQRGGASLWGLFRWNKQPSGMLFSIPAETLMLLLFDLDICF